jgi:hypothetical protein
MYTFKQWLNKWKKIFDDMAFKESQDIFGFEYDVIVPPKKVVNEKPIEVIDVESVVKQLSHNPLRSFPPTIKFVNEIHWGDNTGAIRVRITPKLKVLIERLGNDLSGNMRWYCKRVWQLNREGSGGNEAGIAEEIFEEVQAVDHQEPDSPKRDYDDFQDLVIRIAEQIKKVAAPIFIFEGVRKVNDFNYIIRMSVRGHGLEAPSQTRVEENQTQVVFDKDAGLIRMTNYNLLSEVGGSHEFRIAPPDHIWYFFPSQSDKEIAQTITNVMYWY